jgi:predicted phage tail protein
MYLPHNERGASSPLPAVRLPAPTILNWTRISDLADDGTLDFFVDVSWTPITQESEYSLKIVNTTDGTTSFKRVDNAVVGGVGKYRLPVTSGKSYTTFVRAIGADGGTPSDWSTGSSITVTKKNTAPITPTVTPIVTAGFKQNAIRAGKSTESDVAEIVFYRADGTNNFTTSAKEVGRSRTTKFTDAGLTNGTNYYYWYTYVDRSGNESAKWPLSNTGGIVGTPQKTLAGDYAAGSIVVADTTTTAPAVPTGLGLTQGARDVNGDGVVDMTVIASWTAMTDAKSYAIQVTQGSTVRYYQADDVSTDFRVVAGKLYSVKVRSIGFNGAKSALSSAVTITPVGKSAATFAAYLGIFAQGDYLSWNIDWVRPTDPDYSFTEIYWLSTSTAPVAGTAAKAATADTGYWLTLPLVTTASSLYIYARHVDRSGNRTPWEGANVGTGGGTATTAIACFSNSKEFSSGTNGSTSVAGTGAAILVESVAATLPDTCNHVDVWVEFRNNSGGSRTFDITLEDAATAGASVLRTWPGSVMADGNYFGMMYRDIDPNPLGTTPTKTYRLRVASASAGAVIRTKVAAKVKAT